MKNKRKLNKRELVAERVVRGSLAVVERKTKRPLVIALVGLVGSGKSSVAQELAGKFGATIISGDDIRLELAQQEQSYDKAFAIAEVLAEELACDGRNVILDSDFVDAKKRASLREKIGKAAHVVFVRTICDFDVMSQRIRENDPGIFFNKASSRSTANDNGKDVKFRELSRRIPHHYRWVTQGGGKWVPRKLPFVSITIDTTQEGDWERAVARAVLKYADTLPQ